MTTTTRPYIGRGAVFSADHTYRYFLTRSWEDIGDGTRLNIIGLNPSTADARVDDPTIRRCIGFARQWGFSALTMTNLFALRSTDPGGLQWAGDPVGPENDVNLIEQARYARVVVAAWGVHGALFGRDAQVQQLLQGISLQCLGVTKAWFPKHPLYLPRTAELRAYP